MGTPARLNAMPLETVRLAERWKARAPVWAYSRAMLPAFTPLPGADHEGPAFFAPENTAVVLDFIEAQLSRKER